MTHRFSRRSRLAAYLGGIAALIALAASAATLLTPSLEAGTLDVVQDGSFEAGTPNPFWDEASSTYGTPLCTLASCGDGDGTGPRTGDWWLWFGGVADQVEEGSMEQSFVIPEGDAVLTFFLEIPVSRQSGEDFLEVYLDDDLVFRVTDLEAEDYAAYTQVIIDADAFADGQTHTLTFLSMTFSDSDVDVTNFFIDDVALVVDLPPTPTPTLSATSTPTATATPTATPTPPPPTGPYDWASAVSGQKLSSGLAAGEDAGGVLAFPWLGGDADERALSVVNAGATGARIGILFFNDAGLMLPVMNPASVVPQRTFTTSAIPGEATSALVFGIDGDDAQAVAHFQAISDRNSLRAFVEHFRDNDSGARVTGSLRLRNDAGETAYNAPTPPRFGVSDGGFTYHVPGVRTGGDGEAETAIAIQNLGGSPIGSIADTSAEVTFVAEGETSATQVVTPIEFGESVEVRLAEVFGAGKRGEVIITSQSMLAVTASTSGTLTTSAAQPQAICDVEGCSSSTGGQVLYGSILPDPVLGWATTLELTNLNRQEQVEPVEVQVDYFDASGALAGSQTVALLAEGFVSVPTPGDLDLGGQFGHVRVTAVSGEPAAEVAGYLRAEREEQAICGVAAFDYDLSTLTSSISRQAVSGLVKDSGPFGRTSRIAVTNTGTALVEARIRFLSDSAIVHDLDLTIEGGETVTVDLGSVAELPTGFQGGAVVSGSDKLVAAAIAQATEPPSGCVVGLGVTKQADRQLAAVGDTIGYTIVVQNTGDLDITGIAIADSLVGTSAITCLPPEDPAKDDGILEPEEQMTCVYEYTVQEGDPNPLVNTATVTGLANAIPVTGAATVLVTLDVPVTPTPTTPAGIELFEGWNPIESWPGPVLQFDAINTYFDQHVSPNVWAAIARFDGEGWLQRFKTAPLPSFQTLTQISPGHEIWVFATAPAVLEFDE